MIEVASNPVVADRQRFGLRVGFLWSTFETSDVCEPFEVMFLINKLEHRDDSVASLQYMAGGIGPGGRPIVLAPNTQASSRQITVQTRLVEHDAEMIPSGWTDRHRTTFLSDKLEQAAKQNGLHVIHRGGLSIKALASRQVDLARKAGLVSGRHVKGRHQLDVLDPELCANINLVCESS